MRRAATLDTWHLKSKTRKPYTQLSGALKLFQVSFKKKLQREICSDPQITAPFHTVWHCIWPIKFGQKEHSADPESNFFLHCHSPVSPKRSKSLKVYHRCRYSNFTKLKSKYRKKKNTLRYNNFNLCFKSEIIAHLEIRPRFNLHTFKSCTPTQVPSIILAD